MDTTTILNLIWGTVSLLSTIIWAYNTRMAYQNGYAKGRADLDREVSTELKRINSESEIRMAKDEVERTERREKHQADMAADRKRWSEQDAEQKFAGESDLGPDGYPMADVSGIPWVVEPKTSDESSGRVGSQIHHYMEAMRNDESETQRESDGGNV